MESQQNHERVPILAYWFVAYIAKYSIFNPDVSIDDWWVKNMAICYPEKARTITTSKKINQTSTQKRS